jgi:predicted P-loop ATPase
MITGKTEPTPREAAPVPRPDPYAGYEFIPVPADAPDITPGQKTPPARRPKFVGTDKEFTTYTPSDVYAYFNSDGELLGYVIRQDLGEGKKITPGLWWAKAPDGYEGWSHGSLPAPRPLYGLPELLAHPDKQVLIVEGEKCRRAADKALGGRVVVISWLGGTSAVAKTDWSPLRGRSLLLWPDHDEGGYRAMHEVAKLAKPERVKWVRSYAAGKGADVADVVADGLSVADYIKGNVSAEALVWDTAPEEGDDATDRMGNSNVYGDSSDPGSIYQRHGNEREASRQDGGTATTNRVPVDDSGETLPEVTTDADWQTHVIWNAKGDGIKGKSIHNAMLYIQYHELFQGIFAYNEFNHKIYMMRRPPWNMGRGKWEPTTADDDDATALRGYLETVGISLGKDDTFAAVARVAKHNRFNPVRERLESLVWDGVERLSKPYCWLSRYLGADPTEINRAFGRKFLVSACARIMQPGVKVDTVLVIEGEQGSQKSSSLRALCSVFGDKYFLDNLSDPYGKDGKMLLQGKLIVELAELEAFSRSEVRQEKSFITTQVDEFRPPFGRSVIEYPRTFIIAGSTNQEEYLKDPTGARRFWPVRTGEIDLDLLREDAEQLWAEAYQAYLAGEQWWLTPDEEKMAQVEQAKRYKTDPWVGLIAAATRAEVHTTVNEVLTRLDVNKKERTIYMNERVVSILKMMGWEKDGDGFRRQIDG